MKTYHIKYLFKRIPQTPRALLIIVLAYLGLLIMDYSASHQHNSTICIFKLVTGKPCPGCGLGRATLALMRGDFSQSFQYNILCIPITLIVIISVCWLIADLLNRKETFFKTINRPVKIIYLIPFFIITGISWYINIIRGI